MSSWVYWHYFRPGGGREVEDPLKQAREIVNKILDGEEKYSDELWDKFIQKANKDCIIPIKDISFPDENYDVEVANLEICVRGLYQRYVDIPFIEEYDSLQDEYYRNIGLTLGFAFLFTLSIGMLLAFYSTSVILKEKNIYSWPIRICGFFSFAFLAVWIVFAIEWSKFNNNSEKGERRDLIIEEKDKLLN